jgi:hypothetical protein
MGFSKRCLADVHVIGYTAPQADAQRTRKCRVVLNRKARKWLLVAGVFLIVCISYLFVYFVKR